jgi:uncharacterized membrane protein YeaQ/YmgE (transglycosylase-associated protein family)
MLLLFWIMDALAASWLTGRLMSREARDQFMEIAMAVAGGVTGGLLLSSARFTVQGRMVYTNLAAILGAVTVTVLSRYVGARREYGATR